ncbi:MAG: hypothetical protein GF411_03335 [Candidatus Lokiarchaeota archaeon]|nr:hypothetical protein [Candidatus Lokiarchaeota archaeon]
MSQVAFEEEKTKVFDWIVIVLVAIIYSLNAFLLEGAAELFPHEERIIIMVPAYASIVFGPIIGGLGAGFGNLLLDIFEKVVLSNEGLAARHVLGFFANMIGGATVGLLSKRITMQEKDEIFTFNRLILSIKNTFASVFGLSVITGTMIGFGRFFLTYVGFDDLLTGSFTTGELFTTGASLAGIIITGNGVVLLMSMIPLQFILMYVERRRVRNYNADLRASRVLAPVTMTPNPPVEILEFTEQGKGFVLRRWSTVRIRLKNLLDRPMRFRIEMVAQDHVDPNVFYTELMDPGSIDVIDLQFYPFDDAHRVVRLVVRPWVDNSQVLREVFEKDQQFAFEYAYKVFMPSNRRIKVLISIVGILALIIGIIRGMQSILVGTGTAPFLVTLGVVVAEIVFVLMYFIYRRRQMEAF